MTTLELILVVLTVLQVVEQYSRWVTYRYDQKMRGQNKLFKRK